MENKDHLDAFMRQKFAADDPAERFPFREDYWLQAQAMIEAAERRKRHRFVIWWWTLSGLGIVLLGAWWLWGRNGSVAAAGQAAGNGQEPAVAVATPPDSPTEHPNAYRPSGSGAPEFQPPAAQPSLETARPAGQHTSASWQTTDSRRPGQKADLADAGRIPYSGAAGREVREPGTGRQARALPAASPPRTAAIAGSAGTVALPPGAVSGAAEEPDLPKSPANPDALEEKIPKTDVEPNRSKPQQPLLLSAFLPQAVVVLVTPLRPLPASRVQAARIEPAKSQRQAWRRQTAVVAAVSAPLTGSGDKSVGFAAGFTECWQRSGSPVSFQAGLLWRWRRGGLADGPPLAQAEQLRFGFGYTFDAVQQYLTATHWLELPLAVRYNSRHWYAEAGLAARLLLIAQGREDRIRESSLQVDAGLAESRIIRLDGSGLYKTNGSVFAGAGWQVLPQVDLGLRLHYQPGSLIRATDVLGAVRQPLWVEVQAAYKF